MDLFVLYKILDKITPRVINRRIVDLFSCFFSSFKLQKLLISHFPQSKLLRQIFIYSFLEPTGKRGWVLAPSSMVYLSELVIKEKPGLIVECGTGRGHSLAALLCGLLANGLGRIVSLEHNKKFVEKSTKKFSNYLKWVCIKHTPLLEDNSYNYIPDSEIDLLLVDGPPGCLKNGRLNTMRSLIPYLSDNGIVLLDDVVRKEEKEALKTISEEFSMSSKILNKGNAIGILKKRPNV